VNSRATSFLADDEIAALGFGEVGERLRLSRFARFYGADRIFIASDVRIDDFAVVSPGDGQIRLEGHNHIGAHTTLIGSISIGRWTTISGRTGVYAKSDDFSIEAVTYPHADQTMRDVLDIPIRIGSRVVIGTGSTVLPGADIADGISVGAMSLVVEPLSRPGLYLGIPARFIRERQPMPGSAQVGNTERGSG
jgi:acetyltransferase-like isoleucine patch superfamily enzyme